MKFVCTPRNAHAPDFIQIMWTSKTNEKDGDCSSSYNAIIRRPTLNSWRATMSIYHLSAKFPIEYGIGKMQGDQLAARECYVAMLAMDEQM